MSSGTAQAIAAAAAAPNPANAPAKRVKEGEHISMDVPNAKLAVPQIEGYYLYWHLGKNVARALRHGYVFVDPDEVEVEQTGLGNDARMDGNTDLGTRISVSAGDSGEAQEERLYLMKLPMDLHEKDMEHKTARNEAVAVRLRAGNIGADGDPDRNKRYMKAGQDLFYPKKAR